MLNKRLQRCQESSLKLGLGIIAVEGFEALSTIVPLPDLATLRQRIAETLLHRLKKRQLLGCLDPARFAVLFEDETETEINDQLTAITTALHQQVLEKLDELPQLKASFGFALYPRDAATSRELWTMAFQALTDQTYNSQRKVVPGR